MFVSVDLQNDNLTGMTCHTCHTFRLSSSGNLPRHEHRNGAVNRLKLSFFLVLVFNGPFLYVIHA